MHTLDMEVVSTYYGPNMVYATCGECHNPDGDGVGSCQYYADDVAEALAWFEEHAA